MNIIEEFKNYFSEEYHNPTLTLEFSGTKLTFTYQLGINYIVCSGIEGFYSDNLVEAIKCEISSLEESIQIEESSEYGDSDYVPTFKKLKRFFESKLEELL